MLWGIVMVLLDKVDEVSLRNDTLPQQEQDVLPSERALTSAIEPYAQGRLRNSST